MNQQRTKDNCLYLRRAFAIRQIVLLLVAVFFIFFIFDSSCFSLELKERESLLKVEERGFEATRWIKAFLEQPCPLAPHRFSSSSKALAFIEHLYHRGAVYVSVILIMEEPVGLRIYLPLDQDARARILRIVNRECEKFGFAKVRERNQEDVSLWWS